MQVPVDKLAKAAYEAYSQDVGGVSVRGEPLPTWENISPRVQSGWMAAVLAVAEGLLIRTTCTQTPDRQAVGG